MYMPHSGGTYVFVKFWIDIDGYELAPESWAGLILVGYGFKGLIPILYRGYSQGNGDCGD